MCVILCIYLCGFWDVPILLSQSEKVLQPKKLIWRKQYIYWKKWGGMSDLFRYA